MSDPGQAGALVCGFSDLAAGLGGVAWDVGESGGLLLEHDEVKEATVEISDEDGGVRLKLDAGGSSTEVSLSPRTGLATLPGANDAQPPGGALGAAICSATVKAGGKGRTLQCAGHLSRWAENPVGDGTFRHLAIEGFEGSVLVVVARGAAGAKHGEEDIAAWRLDGEGGFLAFEDALLSTQYDKEGRQARAGLELWPHDEDLPPMRAAGTRVGGTDADGIAAAILRCSTEGAEGFGSYLVSRG